MIDYQITRNSLSISTTNVLFNETPLNNCINEPTEASSRPPLVTTTINNLLNSKSTLQKGDEFLQLNFNHV